MSERLFRDARREAELDRRGHLVLPLLGPDELALAWALYREEHGDGFPPQARDGVHMTIWCSDRAYKERVRAGLERALLAAVEREFVDLRVVSPVFVVKTGGGGNVFPVHQDWSVVDESAHRALNLWVPLHDVDAEHGALWVVPGSHRLGSTVRGPGCLFPDLRPLEPQLASRRTSIACAAGHAIAFYHRLIHGSPPNERDRPRIAIAASLVPRAVPLRIYFQAAPGQSLLAYEPADDFIYEFENVRDDTARLPPAGEPVAVLPPHDPRPIGSGELEAALAGA